MLHIIRAALRKFIQLDDTPNSYSGLAGKFFKVNSSEDALEASTNTDSEISEAVNVAANVMEKIAEVEVSSDCTYVDFTGLDGNSAWFYVLFVTVKNPSDSNSRYGLFVNGDTTDTNYYSQYIQASGSTDDKGRFNYSRIGFADSGNRCYLEVSITKDPDGYFHWNSFASKHVGPGVELLLWTGSKTATITNITSLRVQASVTNAIGAGSKFILFKARRA